MLPARTVLLPTLRDGLREGVAGHFSMLAGSDFVLGVSAVTVAFQLVSYWLVA
jgi:hypothetical protein